MGLKKNPSVFFKTFVGEYVTMITNIIVSAASATEEQSSSSHHPMMFQGYLLDEDARFYYLGSSNEANMVVKKENVLAVEIEENKTILDNILDSVDESEESMN